MFESKLKILKIYLANSKPNIGNYLDNFVMETHYLTATKSSKQSEIRHHKFEKMKTESEELEDDPQHENIVNKFGYNYWAAYRKNAIVLNNILEFPNIKALKGDDNNIRVNNN